MNNYEFTVYESNTMNVIGGGFGSGESAMGAFEKAIQENAVAIESGKEHDVIATSLMTGLSIKFTVYRQF